MPASQEKMYQHCNSAQALLLLHSRSACIILSLLSQQALSTATESVTVRASQCSDRKCFLLACEQCCVFVVCNNTHQKHPLYLPASFNIVQYFEGDQGWTMGGHQTTLLPIIAAPALRSAGVVFR